MFGNRRLAKRSIVGSSVCSLAADGCYYPSVIESTQSWPDCLDSYRVQFKEGPYARTDVSAKEIVGPGFSTVGEIVLIAGQKVFLTQNGREVPGVITDRRADDTRSVCVLVSAAEFGEDELLQRRHDDVRLMASRKSARLQTNDTNYSRLADLHPENKKRPVSNVIDVPVKSRRKHHHSNHYHIHHQQHQHPHQTHNYHQLPLPQRGHYEPSNVEVLGGWTTDAMDEQTAALVLTSLSCSPPHGGATAIGGAAVSSSWKPGSQGSSGLVSSSGSSGSSPSPPPLRASTNQTVATAMLMQRSPIDELAEAEDSHTRKETIFQCTWPGCCEQKKTCLLIEQHVRSTHLGKRQGSDSESDHEEEFYYKEVEVGIDTMTRSFADMNTEPMLISDGEVDVEGNSDDCRTNVDEDDEDEDDDEDDAIRDAISDAIGDNEPTATIYCQSVSADHDYQKKNSTTAPLTIPSRRHSDDQMSALTSQESAELRGYERLSRSSQQYCNARFRYSSSPHKAASASLPSHFSCPSTGSTGLGSMSPSRRSRLEVKKCRKVYGMEKRDAWCTQCKWKKACTRFHE